MIKGGLVGAILAFGIRTLIGVEIGFDIQLPITSFTLGLVFWVAGAAIGVLYDNR